MTNEAQKRSNTTSALATSKYDLTNTLAPYMDLHFMFPLIDFLSNNEVYDETELLHAKLALLQPTNMADFAMEIHKTLYNAQTNVSDEFDTKRNDILALLQKSKETCAPMLKLIENQEKIIQLQNEKCLNANYLEKHEGITSDVLESLYKYAKMQYECGYYEDCLTCLTYYGVLIPNASSQYLCALWGKLAAEILVFHWEDALADINRIHDVIESTSTMTSIEKLQQRTWLLHWSLFIFAWHEDGRDQIVDFMLLPRCVEAIQSNAPWLFRYLCAGVLMHKRRRSLIKDLGRILRHEKHDENEIELKDPIVAFIEYLFVQYDFENAQTCLLTCEVVLANDFFLYEKNQIDFMENARMSLFEAYCRVHRTIDMVQICEQLFPQQKQTTGTATTSTFEAEKWIVKLIRNTRLDAKIDAQNGLILMGQNHTNNSNGMVNDTYRQIIEKTKEIASKTCSMVSQFEKWTKQQQQVQKKATA